MNGRRANIRSLRKYVLKKLSALLAKEAFADMKQSIETICELASETGEVAEKKTSIYFGHWKLKEDTKRISWKWFIRIFI